MALRVEIWGLQLIQPLARMWQQRARRPRDRAPLSLSPAALESSSSPATPNDLGVWVGAIRLRDLPTKQFNTGVSGNRFRASERADNVLYLRPRSLRPWNGVEQGNKVRRIFEQNRIVPSSPAGDRSITSGCTPPSIRARA